MKTIVSFLLIISTQFSFSQMLNDSISIYFETNSSIPKNNQSLAQLSNLKTITNINIYAYADTVGSETSNKILAQRRAEAIKQLIGNTIKIESINIIGETSQFGTNDKNRKVTLHYKKTIIDKSVEPIQADTLRFNIEFEPGKSSVLENSYPEIDRLLDTIKISTYSRIEINGYVCCSPNIELSRKRAETVRMILIKNGIKNNLIECFGHGNSNPLFIEDSPEHMQKNRRVEVVLIE